METCARCGRTRERNDHRFCPGCGAPFDSSRERKQVTVLNADLCDSTARVAGLDPEDAQSYLDRALRVMTESVEAYGGTISQTRGDGLVALFGAPKATEDYALHACLASLAMQARLAEASTPQRTMVARIGLDSGEAVLGWDSEYLPSHYRAEGPPLHVAARLQALAPPGGVLMSGATQRLVAGQVECHALGSRAIRGIEGEVSLYEVIGATRRSAAEPLARRRRLAPLIGRDEVLAAFGEIAEQARGAQLRVIGVRGEAGIGKSRLVAELCDRLRAQGFAYCAVAGRAYANQVPCGLMSDLARVLMRLPADADARQQRAQALRFIEGWPESQAWHRAAMSDLLDLGEPGAAWRSLTPKLRLRRIADALQSLIEQRLADGPMVIAIDDVFLADADSVRLLGTLVRHLERRPLLICATYRQDFVHRWSDAAWFAEQWVGPLASHDMAAMARTLLGEHASLTRVASALIERADGNPFFLEELAMTLVDEGSLQGEPGDYRCERAAEAALRVPASIAAVIGARVDRLPAGAKASLEAAAILGEPVSPASVAAMQRLGEAEVARHLNLALGSGLLAPAAADPNPSYAFRHGLVQEVLVGGLTRPRRKQLHRQAFAALHALGGAAPGDIAALLVHHAYSGEAWDQAAEFALPAMSRAIARSANRDALRVFALGLDAAGRLESDAQKLPLELGLRMEAMGALLPLNKIDDIVENLERAEAITRVLGDARRQAAASLQLAVTLWTQGRYRQGLAAAENAAAAAEAAESRTVQMAAVQARMMLHHGLGRYAQATADAAQVECEFAPELNARRLMPGWAVIALVNVKVFAADLLTFGGEFDAAQTVCDAAYRELAAQDHAFSRVLLDFVQGGLWLAQQRYRDAAGLLQSALKSCRQHDVPTMYPPILARLCGALALGGQVPQALAMLEVAIAEKAQQAGGRYNEFYFPFYLSITLAQARRIEDAMAAARQACTAAAASEQRGHEAEALFLLGQLEAAHGDDGAAVGHFTEARRWARECAAQDLERRAQAAMLSRSAGWAAKSQHA